MTKILRILIVEDLPERQQQICNMYKEHAWVTTTISTHAIRLVNAYDFDLIHLDYNLAEQTTGLEVAECLAKSRNAQTQVVIHSMNPDGAKKMSQLIVNVEVIPISKLLKKDIYTKRLKEQLKKEQVNWNYVFKGYM
ncbi:cyclic-phosphate processing receiver domain-containing protein [Candidatus Uabimicrobium amorphum]|nr:cyclic-phosphate processing receiver domain-containing protein [Candidatus Uabimicrobium amorphum]